MPLPLVPGTVLFAGTPPVKMPVLGPVSVRVTVSTSPPLPMIVTVIVSETSGLVFSSRSMTRTKMVSFGAYCSVCGPLFPVVNSVVLGVPRSNELMLTVVDLEELMVFS